ncbi:hypothetical protein PVAND_011278 [Polypedilum vanderplanki]|uniref:Uncharacterized protein n=1 Tax=Polypedilum vanderplanki TaxID=319348 RepID=A0A9J6CJ26_POLVA|nr:hypothetical protein PVAND_011278 [Polypedilum vanderplanki]
MNFASILCFLVLFKCANNHPYGAVLPHIGITRSSSNANADASSLINGNKSGYLAGSQAATSANSESFSGSNGAGANANSGQFNFNPYGCLSDACKQIGVNPNPQTFRLGGFNPEFTGSSSGANANSGSFNIGLNPGFSGSNSAAAANSETFNAGLNSGGFSNSGSSAGANSGSPNAYGLGFVSRRIGGFGFGNFYPSGQSITSSGASANAGSQSFNANGLGISGSNSTTAGEHSKVTQGINQKSGNKNSGTIVFIDETDYDKETSYGNYQKMKIKKGNAVPSILGTISNAGASTLSQILGLSTTGSISSSSANAGSQNLDIGLGTHNSNYGLNISGSSATAVSASA